MKPEYCSNEFFDVNMQIYVGHGLLFIVTCTALQLR